MAGSSVSLPTRERGLKHEAYDALSSIEASLPTRERGLKLEAPNQFSASSKSLPTRERGLKRCEDESKQCRRVVAPYAGAWIETTFRGAAVDLRRTSLPTRERGLKHPREPSRKYPRCRSLRGSVD